MLEDTGFVDMREEGANESALWGHNWQHWPGKKSWTSRKMMTGEYL